MSSFRRALRLTLLTAAVSVVALVGPASGEPAPDLPATVARVLEDLPAAGKGRAPRAVTSPIPFSMVGFEVPPGAQLQFRTSVDGKTWDDWTNAIVEPDEAPDPGSAEGRAAAARMTTPVWVGEAAHLQTRVTGVAAAGRTPEVTAHVIDSSGLGRSWGRAMVDRLKAAWHGSPSAADASVARPTIVTRKQWGADESLRRSSPSYGSRIVAGFVHHTAGSNSYSRSESDDVVRGVYRYHVQSNGWSDIGYNYLIDRYGTIYEGRYGGIHKPVIGAHASGFNTNTFGVSLMGNFVSARPPSAMISSLRHFLAWKYDLHHINVAGRVDYQPVGSSSSVTVNRLSGHRDVGATSCPGAKTYELLPGLRTSVAQLQGPVILYPQVSPSSLDVLDGRSVEGSVMFRARLRPAGVWNVTVFAPDGSVAHRGTGTSRRIAHEWLPTDVVPGTYRWRISSPERMPAYGTLTMEPPRVTAAAAPTRVRYRENGSLHRPIAVTGTMYDGARWALRIIDPDGQRVAITRGTGRDLDVSWNGPVTQPGRYEWRLAVDGLLRKAGPIQLFADRVDRIASVTTSAAAAAGISRRAFPAGTAERAVLVSNRDSAYAMAAAGLAGTGGPVLITLPTQLSEVSLEEMRRALSPTATVHVFGSESVISEAVATRLMVELRRPVVRVEGTSPTRTAATAADIVARRSGTRSAVLVGGVGTGAWRQGLGGAATAAARGVPILLTARHRLSPASRDSLTRNGIQDVTIVGNGTTVSTTTAGQTKSLGIGVRRVSGSSGPRTAVAVSRLLFDRVGGGAHPDDAYLFFNGGRSDGWVRSLTAAPLAARASAPLLFVERTGLPAVTSLYLSNMAYDRTVLGRGTVLGNGDHITGTTRTTLARLLQ